MLGERLSKMDVFSVLLGFVGILIVARPSVSGLSPGIIAGALAAVGFAVTTVLTKRLTRIEKITPILFYLTAMQAVFGIICAGYDGQITLPDSTTAPWLLVIGCTGLMAHFCITRALNIAPATVITPFDFARLPVIAIVGALLYNEPIHFWTIIGAVVIFAANYLNILSNTRKNT